MILTMLDAPPRWWVVLTGIAGLLLSIGLSLTPGLLPEGLTPAAARTLGCAWLMASWWIGSRLPLAVASLVPLALFPVLGVADSKAAAAPYANRLVMLLLAGFLLAQAVERWGLHRRIALHVLVRSGRSAGGLVGGVMVAAAGLSMWISNTATTLMMLPIVLALVQQGRDSNADEAANRRFATSMLLGLAYAASIGGMATPVGTPPNLIFSGIYGDTFPDLPAIDFPSWMRVAVPVALSMGLLAWAILTRVLHRVPADYSLGATDVLRQQLNALGPLRTSERRVAIGFAITCLLWVFHKKLPLPPEVHDSTIAAFMAMVFFITPAGEQGGRLLEWDSAARGVPWGLLLLFGGGISLSAGFSSSGLSTWLAGELGGLTSLPVPLMIAGISLTVTFLTEVTSNTATTALLLPVLASVAIATGVDPLLLMVPATLAASCAFMLPVATPPNAIVIGSRALEPAAMARTGLWLNLTGVVPITVVVWWMLG